MDHMNTEVPWIYVMGKVACVHCPYDTVWILWFDDRSKSHIKLFACGEFIMVIGKG